MTASTVVDLARLPRFVDISCVQAHHGQADIERLAERAREGDFVSAHVLPSWISFARRLLDGSNTLVGGPAGFPSGGSLPEVKLREAQSLLDAGAQEIDVVVNIGRLRSGLYDDITRELAPVVEAVDGAVPLRAILEVGHLDDEQIVQGARAAVRAGMRWVKSGTGWSGRPTTPHHIALMAEGAQGQAELKAAGGIRSLDTVEEMVALGVTRFGMNADVAVDLAAQASSR